MRIRIVSALIVGSFFGLAFVGAPGDVMAQSAADKATARQLATESIRLYRQERYRDALDKMTRAETLYDAPVHLLYIARCQAKLTNLVEAAEVYRKLVRVELPAQAPQMFREAIADGQKELAELEPTVPMLLLEVTPDGLQEVKIIIDDEAVSSAILGINRPINPGAHSIRVEAKGLAPVTQLVKIEVGGKQTVRMELSKGSSGAVEAGAAVSPRQPQAAPDATQATAGTQAVEDKGGKPVAVPARRPVQLIFGLELGGTVTSGSLDKLQSPAPTTPGENDDRKIAGRFGPAVTGEIRAGLSLPVGSFRITPLLFLGGMAHKPGPFFSKAVNESYGFDASQGPESTLETVPTSSFMGLGVRGDTAPTEAFELGAFAELGFIARQVFSTEATWTREATVCKFTEKYTGNAFRVAGGVLMPVSSGLSLEGRLTWSLGSFNEYSVTPGCTSSSTSEVLLDEVRPFSISKDQQATHSVFGLGVAGTYAIGL